MKISHMTSSITTAFVRAWKIVNIVTVPISRKFNIDDYHFHHSLFATEHMHHERFILLECSTILYVSVSWICIQYIRVTVIGLVSK